MEVDVATLFQLIGEQQTEIRVLQQQLAATEPVTEGPPVLTPVTDEDRQRVKDMLA